MFPGATLSPPQPKPAPVVKPNPAPKASMFPGVEFKVPKNVNLEDVQEELTELDEMNFNEFSNDRKPSYIQKCEPRPNVKQDKQRVSLFNPDSDDEEDDKDQIRSAVQAQQSKNWQKNKAIFCEDSSSEDEGNVSNKKSLQPLKPGATPFTHPDNEEGLRASVKQN